MRHLQILKTPVIEVKGSQYRVENGWTAICSRINREIEAVGGKKKLVVIETYQGVIHEELISELNNGQHLKSTKSGRAKQSYTCRKRGQSNGKNMGGGFYSLI